MGKKAKEEQIEVVRSVVGPQFREIDIIRALHLANDDPAAAINIIFDTPPATTSSPPPAPPPPPPPPPPCPLPKDKDKSNKATGEEDIKDWRLIGTADISGLSTCKGSRIQSGDTVAFSFPPAASASLKSPAARGRGGSSGSEIVRFSTSQHGEIGRIPNEWARCLVPLVRDGKVMLQGFCKSAPQVLSIMDSITLTIRFHFLSNCNKFIPLVHVWLWSKVRKDYIAYAKLNWIKLIVFGGVSVE